MIKLHKKYKFSVFALFLLLLLYACDNASTTDIMEENHDMFAEAWNEKAAKVREAQAFQIPETAETLALMEKWLKAFTTQPPAELLKELDKLKEDGPPTTFHAWEEFRLSHHRNQILKLDREMDNQQLAHAINEWLGIKINGRVPDYVTDKTVKDIVYINSVCSFFANEREKLWQQGIDTGIESCKDLSTKGKYPWLDFLVGTGDQYRR